MTSEAWEAARYLTFESERTQPCRDLVARLGAVEPGTIVDLGCGTGSSTAVLRERWPHANILGVDSSAEMLDRARAALPSVRFEEGDLRSWVSEGPAGLVFSNAALQWVPDHPTELPRLWRQVAEGGALAFQVPVRGDPSPAWVEAWTNVLSRRPWVDHGPFDPRASPVLGSTDYYRLLAPTARRVELWETEYVHVMAGPSAIVEWTRATALRPWLARLGDGARSKAFLEEYAREVARSYPPQPNGMLLFPFRRRFVAAYR